MKPTLKARWIKALRSGRYKQCTFYAQDEDGYNCCLGVLGRILHQKNLLGNKAITPLPTKILDPAMQSKLVSMNDSGKTFSMIADYIEKHIN